MPYAFGRNAFPVQVNDMHSMMSWNDLTAFFFNYASSAPGGTTDAMVVGRNLGNGVMEFGPVLDSAYAVAGDSNSNWSGGYTPLWFFDGRVIVTSNNFYGFGFYVNSSLEITMTGWCAFPELPPGANSFAQQMLPDYVNNRVWVFQTEINPTTFDYTVTNGYVSTIGASGSVSPFEKKITVPALDTQQDPVRVDDNLWFDNGGPTAGYNPGDVIFYDTVAGELLDGSSLDGYVDTGWRSLQYIPCTPAWKHSALIRAGGSSGTDHIAVERNGYGLRQVVGSNTFTTTVDEAVWTLDGRAIGHGSAYNPDTGGIDYTLFGDYLSDTPQLIPMSGSTGSILQPGQTLNTSASLCATFDGWWLIFANHNVYPSTLNEVILFYGYNGRLKVNLGTAAAPNWQYCVPRGTENGGAGRMTMDVSTTSTASFSHLTDGTTTGRWKLNIGMAESPVWVYIK